MHGAFQIVQAEKERRLAQHASISERFKDEVVVFKGFPEEYVLDFVCSKSKFSAQEVLECVNEDNEALDQMMEFEIQ